MNKKMHFLLLILILKSALLDGMQESYDPELIGKYQAEAIEKNRLHPKPKLVVHEWENFSEDTIQIYTMYPEKVLATLNPYEAIILDTEVIPDYAPVGALYLIAAALCANREKYFTINGTYYCGPNNIMTRRDARSRGKLEIDLSSAPMKPPYRIAINPTADINQITITINVITKGSQLEESSIELVV